MKTKSVKESLINDKEVIKNDITEMEIYEKICEAWNLLDTTVLAPYLSDNLVYDSLYYDEPMIGKTNFLEYLSQKFKVWKKSTDVMHANIEEENGVMKPVLRSNSPGIAVYDMKIENGLISKLLIRPSYFRFNFENIDDDYPALLDIAAQSLNDFFTQNIKKPWGWLQNYPTQLRFQDLCIAYNQYVLCICVGMIRKTLEHGLQIFTNQQELSALLSECERHQMTPCMFLIDAEGNPFNKGCHLIDARTYAPIDLDSLKDSNEGKMSDWEINNLGVNTICNVLEARGYTDIDHCDVLDISPQVFFNDGDAPCYVYVRSVPSGCSEKKYYIKQCDLDRLNKGNLKGYFVDIRWANIFGGSGLFNEDYLFRGSQLQDPNRHMKTNLVHNELQFVEIEKAIQESCFIEVIEESQESPSTIEQEESQDDSMKLIAEGNKELENGHEDYAFMSYLTAAGQGNAEGQYLTAECYAKSIGIYPQDLIEAFNWYKKAAEQHHTEAQAMVGILLLTGEGGYIDYSEAVKWLKLAEAKNHARASCYLGYCYANGIGVDQNLEYAVALYKKAAEQNNTDAQNKLGLCYLDGTGVEKNIKEGLRWLNKSASLGDETAQSDLGWLYIQGDVVDQDYETGFYWLYKAIENNCAAAQCKLACCYHLGWGLKKDTREALKWYRKAAEQDDVIAQYNIGWCYFTGDGVKQDYQQAIEWFLKAKEQEYGNAYYCLAECYKEGKGVSIDREKAIEYYEKAWELGIEEAEDDLVKLKKDRK